MRLHIIRYTLGLVTVGVVMVLGAATNLDSLGLGTLWVDDDDATCGGFSPCYRTIQDAVAAAQARDTIRVRPGTYRGPIVIHKSVTLSGESKEGVIITDTVSQGILQAQDLVVISISGSVMVKIENLTVLSKRNYGVSIIGSDAQVTIDHSRFSGHISAISLSRQPFITPFLPVQVPPSGGQLDVLNSDISNNYYGVFIATDGSYTQHIDGNQLLNNSIAIAVSGRGLAVIDKNHIITESQGGIGIRIQGTIEVTAHANIIQNLFTAVEMSESAQALLEDNQITDNAGNGLMIRHNARARLTRNQVLRNGLRSKSLDSPYDPFFGFFGAELKPEGFGVVVGGAAVVELAENYLEGNLFGLGATPSLDPTSKQLLTPRLNAQKNQIVANGWGVWLRGAEATLSNNEITHNDFAVLGIELDPLARFFSLLELFPASGVLVQSGQPLVQSNLITQNGSGVILQGQSSPTLTSNQIINNSQYGIALYQKPCFDQVATELGFQGKVLGEANELSGNAKGDLCPADYSWPPGFRKP